MNDNLKDFSDNELLLELIERNSMQDTCNHVTYCYPHKTICVGISSDEVADIVLSVEALDELKVSNA